MKNTIRYRIAIFSLSLLALLTWTPLPFTVTASSFSLSKQSDEHFIVKLDKRKERLQTLQLEALALYQSMRLQHTGLNEQAFIAAWTGFQNLKEAGKLNNTQVLTICDYSQSSAQKRLYILDIALKKVMVQTYVAHGRNSGLEFATDFSNKPSSYKSSIGFYVTGNSYRGIHGPALNIIGMDQGFNDRASERRIVIHGADYVGNAYLRNKKMIGRSLGCPAVPRKETNRIIQQIKLGSCFFIYHPSMLYFASSTVLNG